MESNGLSRQLPGEVLLPKHCGREEAEPRLLSHPVVEDLDVLGYLAPGFLPRGKAAVVDEFGLQRTPATFHRRVDAPMSRSGYGVSQIREDQRIEFAHDIALQAALKGLSGILCVSGRLSYR